MVNLIARLKASTRARFLRHKAALILQKPIQEEDTLGFIPYYYDKAKEYWDIKGKVEDSIENYKEPKNRSVAINPKLQEDLLKKMEMDKEMTLDDIDWSEDCE